MRGFFVAMLTAATLGAVPAMAASCGGCGTAGGAGGIDGVGGIDHVVRRIEREMDRLTRGLESDLRRIESPGRTLTPAPTVRPILQPR